MLKPTLQIPVACVLCALAAVGCKETVEGKHLDTQGIAMVVDVTAKDDSKSEMRIEFLAGGDESNTFVNLEDDEVKVGAGGKTKVIDPQDKGEYETTFATAAGGTEFTVALDRSDADKDDATDNSGVLPEPFTASVDGSGDHSRKNAVTIKWDPSGDADEVRIDIDGDCVFFTFVDEQADDGEYIVAADELTPISDEDKQKSCEATVTVTRTIFGTTDAVFDPESKFRLHQVRSATFQSVP